MEEQKHRRAIDIFVEQEDNLAKVIRELPSDTLQTIGTQSHAPILHSLEDALYTNIEMFKSAISNQVTGELGAPARDLYVSVLEERIKSRESHKKAYILSLDLDDFGKFNKEYGQLNGDDALRKVTSIVSKYCLRNSERDNDVRIFHPHGEELEVLMYVENDSVAKTIAERIRKGIEQQGTFVPRFFENEKPVTLTISGGLTEYHADIERFEDAFSRADSFGAYYAKAKGKNRIEFVETVIEQEDHSDSTYVKLSDPMKYDGVIYEK